MNLRLILFLHLIAINCHGMKRAIDSGDLQAVAQLLNQGIDVNSTVFYNASGAYIPLLNYSAMKEKKEIVELLILRGANVDADYNGYTSLYTACNCRNYGLAKLLLKNGANPDLSPFPPLRQAVVYHEITIVKLLLEFKASTLIKDIHNRTVFDFIDPYTPQEIIGLLYARKEEELKNRLTKCLIQ